MNPLTTARRDSLKLRIVGVLRVWLGRALEALGAPARIKEFEYVDQGTNQTVYLSTGTRYSVLHVGDKQFFFERASGRFDGTGASLQLSVADRVEFGD
jgi:hypothetical protein